MPPVDRRYRLLPWLATLATLLMAVFAIGAIRTSTVDLPAAVERRLYVAELTGQITHLDEVLTMSAWMVANTGDPRGQRRYDAHVGRLGDAIRSLRAVSPELCLPLCPRPSVRQRDPLSLRLGR